MVFRAGGGGEEIEEWSHLPVEVAPPPAVAFEEVTTISADKNAVLTFDSPVNCQSRLAADGKDATPVRRLEKEVTEIN